MVLAVPPDFIDELLSLFASEDVEAAVIGEFTNDRRLKLFYQGNLVCDLAMEFLHCGIPQVERIAFWQQSIQGEPEFDCPSDLGGALLDILGLWNVCSKEWVIRQYDHEVQGGSILKPLVGKENDGPGDAAVIQPVPDTEKGVVVACGIKPRYGDIDPYWMAASAIDEALRQVVAVGGDPSRVALLDNFCWGNVKQPHILGALVRAARACYDMAVIYETPFISGKDSLYNEFEDKGEIISIPHTLLISAVSIIDDVNRAVSMDFKKAGNLIYVVGDTWNELGGSEYLRIHNLTGNSIPRVRPRQAKWLMERLAKAIADGFVSSCHDCSDGGIGVALAEMAFAGGLGALVHLKSVPLGEQIGRDDFIIFSESNSRFLVEVAPESEDNFLRVMKDGIRLAPVGQVTDSGVVEIYGKNGSKVLCERVDDLKEAWQRPMRW
jgi:phosphoribosylformylglycinamidine synthase